MSLISGLELRQPEAICQWFLQEGKYNDCTWTGEYTGRVYCTYTCSASKFKSNMKFIDVAACPYLEKLDIQCSLLETARVLEGYYIAKKDEQKLKK